jgi:hypothetical protein
VGVKTLEKYELDPETFKNKIEIEQQIMTVGQFADQLNAAIDEVQISAKDKKQIRKVVEIISKKHDIKMPPEVQLLVIMGKIGIETHIKLVGVQVAFMDRIMEMQPAFRMANASHIPNPEDVPTHLHNSGQGQRPSGKGTGKPRGPYRKKNKQAVSVENQGTEKPQFREPGEK